MTSGLPLGLIGLNRDPPGKGDPMKELEPLIGEWHGEGEIPTDPPMKISAEVRIERLGEFIVMRSVGEPAEVPDSISIIGGAPEGEPQPMHYFDSRGVKRLYMTALEGSTWRIWRTPGEDWNGPHGPGFNQRFIGEISADGKKIEGRWERGMGDAGDEWELDFPINHARK
jgi:hypothetical protein